MAGIQTLVSWSFQVFRGWPYIASAKTSSRSIESSMARNASREFSTWDSVSGISNYAVRPGQDTDFFLRALAHFRIRIDREPEQAVVLRMARAQGLSVYDAAYLELAYREKLPLATLDRRLGEAARLTGVQLFEKGR